MGIEIARVDNTGIYGFFNEYRWLSNFHVCDVMIDGQLFPSSEHAFMYGKLPEDYDTDKSVYESIISLSCKDVKAWGRTIPLREDWEDIKLEVMENALYSKFTLNKDLNKKLIETGDLYLEETNFWKDTFWGVCEGVGKNNMGKLLMKVRNDIKWGEI
jgi:ribA/ribD-fused uncharacterized protein